MNLVRRFFELPSQSCFIFGPRGTGKSTWLATHLPEAYTINLLNDLAYRTYQAQPERLLGVVRAQKDKKIFILDEIQRVPTLLNSVHQLIEEDKQRQFIMTGSSARKLKHTGVNLLAGRALVTHMHPFMASELGKRFALDQTLKTGMIPLIVDATDDSRKSLEAYLTLYIREEVQMEGLVRGIGGFARFLEMISFSHGSLLNVSNIAREAQLSRKMVDNYISILEDLLIAYRIPVFNKRAKRTPSVHPKFYFFDVGVYRRLRPSRVLDQREEIYGAALEGLVAQHLKAWCDYSGEQTELYFWRTSSGVEVDFILYGEKYFYALEVKAGANIHATDLRSLKTFHADYPECTPVALYGGNDRVEIDGILCLPVENFLRQLRPKQWPE
ncbi:MAG: AAA family ATPase [Pseudomonadota bacterium]